MGNVKYKQYSPEEDKIYFESIAAIREEMKNGLTFDKACDTIKVENEELKKCILDDALKIMIAEMHYGKGVSLGDVASVLNIPIGKVSVASLEMLEDAGVAAAELNRKSTPNGPAGNA